MPFHEARALVEHPVSCIDCHTHDTMQLRITRPAFAEGIRQLKASQGVENYDVNTMATRQEMRSFVCAQCHVEYYFQGPNRKLVFPWSKGIKAEQMMDYYDEAGFHDWVHSETGAKMIKAQHPEFELWSQGVHARSGVSCSDCHMPYKREGALKISDHHVRSPMLNINRACQTCHNWPERELLARVETIQDRTVSLRTKALDALMDLIDDLKAARERGYSDEQLEAARHMQRRASFMVDYVESENSTGFHAGQEAVRILGESINYSRMGQMEVRKISAQAPATRSVSAR
jgi:nitrite reductase (cytochrome c-552)